MRLDLECADPGEFQQAPCVTRLGEAKRHTICLEFKTGEWAIRDGAAILNTTGDSNLQVPVPAAGESNWRAHLFFNI